MKSKQQAVWNKTDGRCWYCGKELERSDSYQDFKNRFVPDHMVPKCQGGSNDLDNLVPACWSCNSKKAGKNVEEYRAHVALRDAGIPYFTPQQIIWLKAQNFDFGYVDLPVFWGEE